MVAYLICSVFKFFTTNNSKVTILMRFPWPIVKVAVYMSKKTFRFVNDVYLVNVRTPSFSRFKWTKLQSYTVQTVKNHVQSFHAAPEREIRRQIITMTSHLPTGQSSEIRRVPHSQFLEKIIIFFTFQASKENVFLLLMYSWSFSSNLSLYYSLLRLAV